MKPKPCPLCGKPCVTCAGGVHNKWRVSCTSSKCPYGDVHVDFHNRLPRRDPLQRQKDDVVKAVLSRYDNHNKCIVGTSERLNLAVEAFLRPTENPQQRGECYNPEHTKPCRACGCGIYMHKCPDTRPTSERETRLVEALKLCEQDRVRLYGDGQTLKDAISNQVDDALAAYSEVKP